MAVTNKKLQTSGMAGANLNTTQLANPIVNSKGKEITLQNTANETPTEITPFSSTPAATKVKKGTRVDTGNTGLRGVSDNTAQQVANYGQGYTQSDAVTQAQQTLQNTLNNRPGDYQSKYGAQLDSVLQQITNPQKFNYNFNDDELFRYYADLYNQQGRQASQDTMGQAAALTGGYGNSYAQAAGNQAYQQYLLGLYDKGMDLRNAAYQMYSDDLANQYNQLNALQNADQTDYARYRDTVSDWSADRDYYTQAEAQAYNRDYGAWSADRDYWNQQQQLENGDWWNATNYNETMRQNDAARQLSYDQLAEQQRQYNQSMAYNYVMSMIKAGKRPSAALLEAAGLSQKNLNTWVPKASSSGGSSYYAPEKTTTSSGTKNPNPDTNTQKSFFTQMGEKLENADLKLKNKLGATYKKFD